MNSIMASDNNDIGSLFSTKLQLGVKDYKTKSLQRELDKTPFKIFETVSDHGFYTWNSRGSHIAIADVISSYVVENVDLNGKPDAILPMNRLYAKIPYTFKNLPAMEVVSTFPYGNTEICGLYASVQKKVDLTSIDFVFGGSVLQMLAKKEDDPDTPYYVTIVEGTNIALVSKRKSYVHNATEVGFQFERFVTGRPMPSSAQNPCHEHLHVMRVGEYNVLFRAEVDAIDSNDEPVELTFSNPRYWQTRKMFQMISSGSTHLISGEKRYGVTLASVTNRPLSQVANEALRDESVRALETAVLNGMHAMKVQLALQYGTVFRIRFRGSELLLQEESTCTMLPPTHVINKLLDLPSNNSDNSNIANASKMASSAKASVSDDGSSGTNTGVTSTDSSSGTHPATGPGSGATSNNSTKNNSAIAATISSVGSQDKVAHTASKVEVESQKTNEDE